MVIERVPRVNFRPKHLIKVYSFGTDSVFNDAAPVDRQTLLESIKQLSPIGAIQKISIQTERDFNEWRELNYDTLGRIMEVYPTLPEYKVTVEKIALFKEHLLDTFKAVNKDVFSGDSTSTALQASFNIYNQITPITLVIDMLSPQIRVNSTTKQPTLDYSKQNNITVIVYDCWFDKSEIVFDIEADRDLAIVQSAELTCAGLLVYK